MSEPRTPVVAPAPAVDPWQLRNACGTFATGDTVNAWVLLS